MTISSQTNRAEHVGDGSTVAFAYGQKFLASTDLKVYVAAALVSSDDYTVTGAGLDAGGTVTFDTAPANLAKVVIINDPPTTQAADYSANDDFPAETHEAALDKLTLLAQANAARIARSVRLADGLVSSFDPTIPTDLAPGDVLRVNDAGTAFEGLSSDDIETVADNIEGILAAETHASDAESSASAASTSATNAAASASAAATSATNAASSATTATTQAAAAATSATNAATSATSASSSASSASTSASNASTSATAAAASATAAATAETNAETAETNAETAQTAAEAARDAARLAMSGAQWAFDNATADADPGAGEFRLNHATPSSVTQIFVSETDAHGASVGALLALLDDSDSSNKAVLVLRKVDNPAVFACYTLTAAITDAGAYDKLTVSHVASSGTFTAGDAIALSAWLTGDKGAAGAGSGDMLAANNLSDVASVATARTNLDVYSTAETDAAISTATGSLGTLSSQDADAVAITGGTIAGVTDIDANAGTLTANDPFTLAQTWDNAGVTFKALSIETTDTASNAASLLADMAVGGASQFQVRKNGYVYVSNAGRFGTLNGSNFTGIEANATVLDVYANGSSPYMMRVSSSFVALATLGFGSTAGANVDAILQRDTNFTLAQRNGTNAQSFRLYNTYTSSTNYERLGLNWSGNVCSIATEAQTGTQRALHLKGSTIEYWGAAHEFRNAADSDYAPILANVSPTPHGTESLGYRGFGPQQAKSADYTLVLTDAGRHIVMNSASSENLTIPPNASVAFPISNTAIPVDNIGAGTLVLTPDVGVTLLDEDGTSGSVTLNQYHGGVLYKRDTNTWVYRGSHA